MSHETSIIRFIIRMVRPFWLVFFNMSFTVLAHAVLYMCLPYIFALVVDEVLGSRRLDLLPALVAAFGVLLLGGQLLYAVRQGAWIYLRTAFNAHVSQQVHGRTVQLQAHVLERSRTGDFVRTINEDAERFLHFMHFSISHVLSNLFQFGAALFFVATIDWRAMLLMIIAVPVSTYASRRLARWARRYHTEYRSRYGKYVGWIFEVITGLRDLQLLGAQRSVGMTFIQHWRELLKKKAQASTVDVGSQRLVELVSLVADMGLYILAALLIVDDQLTVGAFVALVEYFVVARFALRGINWLQVHAQEHLTSIRRVQALLEEPVEESTQGRPMGPKRTVEFRDVTFRYQRGQQVLTDVSFTIGDGESVAIVGASGAGKSSLVNLLLRFYEPTTGSVLVGDVDSRSYNLTYLRTMIGVVHQDPLLYSDTVRSNVALARPDASDSEVWEACERAGIAAFIQTLPEGLHSVIGPRGREVSGGQRQRLAIARILLKDPQILVLDEATSALDDETEAGIQEAIEDASRQRTTMIIAHRLSTVLNVDRIVVLAGGCVVAIGPHASLIRDCEAYRKLFLVSLDRSAGVHGD